MKSIGCKLVALGLALGLSLSGLTSVPASAAEVASGKPMIQLAILLDTSSSMDGLINQARTQLWRVVNELLASRRAGQRPELQVAVYEYGNQGLSSQSGYIRQVAPLTTDLDLVSEALFGLRTNGGDEYCGQVIQVASQELAWSPSSRDLKIIFIAGNEPFDQGSVDFRASVKQAISHGIVVNTIHCGTRDEGIRTHWQEGAQLADGSYLAIDQNQAIPQVAAPQDGELARLGQELNRTYVAYGRRGAVSAARQRAQDTNAAGAAPAAMAERAAFKSSGDYNAEDWDLVDADKKGKVKLEQMEAEELPAEMRELKPTERKAYVETQHQKRTELQARIQKLTEERRKYVTEKERELAKSGADTLDGAMLKSVRAQAEKKSYAFE